MSCLLMQKLNAINRSRFTASQQAREAISDGLTKETSLQAVRPRAALDANADVRFGSLAGIGQPIRDVRFTPKSGHVQRRARCRPVNIRRQAKPTTRGTSLNKKPRRSGMPTGAPMLVRSMCGGDDLRT